MIKQTSLLILIFSGLFFSKLQAQSVVYVTNLADSGPGSLRNKISAAFPGDTIRFQVTGTIFLSSGELNFNKNLVIDGPGVSLLTITSVSSDRLFIISGQITISKLRLLNGYSSTGMYSGGITCTGGTLRLNHVKFENCTAADLGDIPRGGALRASCDSLFVNHCDFINNGVTSTKYATSGGAIYAYAIKQIIRNSTFDSNQVDAGADTQNGVHTATGYGGAVHLVAKTNSVLLVDSCQFTNNVCNAVCLYSAGAYQGQGHAYGGAIHIDGLHNQLSSAINNSTFTGNLANGTGVGGNRSLSFGTISLMTVPSSTKITALNNLILDNNEAIGTSSYAGVGAIYSFHGGITMNNLKVTNNTSYYEAIKVDESSYARIEWSSISGNSSGGLRLRQVDSSDVKNNLFSNNGKVALQLDQLTGANTTANSTFTGNTSVQGSAMRIEFCTGPVTVLNCTMMDDTVTVAGMAVEMYLYNSPQVYLKNNIISTPTFTSDPLVQSSSTSIISQGGNIVRDATLSLFLVQANDMNSTDPMLGTFDDHGGPTKTFNLLASSPAINLGGTDTLTIDQRGFLRDVQSDAGAFENNATNPNNPVVMNLSNDTTICALQTITLSVTSNNIPQDPIEYQWKKDNVNVPGANTPSLSITPSAAGIFNYTCELSNNSASVISDTITVTVNSLPVVDASNSTSICAGGNTSISAIGATTYSWNNGLGTGSSHTVSPGSTTIYTVTGTDGNGCQNTDQVTITVNQLPLVDAGNAASICIGNNTTISASGTVSYSWDNGLGAGSSHSIAPASTTTYTVTGTDGNGCQNTDQVTITVNQLPVVDASNSTAICAGSNTTISATGTVSYSWDNGLGTGSSHTVSPTSTTTYNVTGTDVNGCQNTDQVTITVNQLPVVDAGNSSTICAGNNATISATGATSYSWNNGLGAGSSHSVSPTSTTLYTVTGTDGNGCQNTDQVTITVNQLPLIDAGSATSICIGDNTMISASGAISYFWDNGLGVGTSHTVSPNITTTYMVTGTDGNGCQNTDQVIVTVNSYPSVVSNGDTAICLGGSATISATGADSYSWNNGLGAGASHVVSPGTTMTFIVTGTTNGCSATDEVIITVNPIPVIGANGSTTICAGENATISANGGIVYTWNNGLGTGATHVVSPLNTTTYTVTGNDVNGCQNTAQVTITVNQLPNTSTTLGADQLTITSNNTSATYNWVNCNNGFQPVGSTNQSYTVTMNGSYAVILTQNGCSDTSNCVFIDYVGLNEMTNALHLSLVPNPTFGKTQVITSEKILNLRVIDNSGKQLEVDMDITEGWIDFSTAPSGSYFIEILTKTVSHFEKISVIH